MVGCRLSRVLAGCRAPARDRGVRGGGCPPTEFCRRSPRVAGAPLQNQRARPPLRGAVGARGALGVQGVKGEP